MKERALDIIGWREWVGLPEWGIKFIKAKVDSGAKSSSIHATNLEEFKKDGESWVRFRIHPVQRNSDTEVTVETKIIEYRSVRSSSGKASLRPVVKTNIELLGTVWPIEITLANRDEMGFRMLLGRDAFRNRFCVDAGKSYYNGNPKKGELI